MATLIDIGKASLCLEALPSEILLEISAAILCIDRRSALQLRLTCKALFGPATDVILGKQDLNHSHEPMEQQTRLIHYCHTVRFWLHVEWEPPFDSEGMVGTPWSIAVASSSLHRQLDLAIGQNVWAPDLAPIWKHHYSNCASKDTEIHVFHPFSLENSDGEDAETVKITAIELHRQQIAAVQLRQQWPGAFDGSLEKTIREFAPNLRHDARIVFMSQGLASHGNGRTRPQVRIWS